ncbi:MAG: hypothetical protein ACE5KC_04290 [Candidatus Bathyarchaeia archaeon]
MKPTKIPPALTLLLLAPTIAELLSGSAPPSEFFNPMVFLLLASLYGSGAIVARELKIRWRKSYGSLLLFGAAYGILEEGLAVKSFFDPNWPDLGVLGVFGRWADVNWVWAEMLTIYHAVFSITIPVILAELAYPERRETSWVSDRVLKVLIVALGAVTVFVFFVLTPYVPPWPQFLFTIFLMITLIFYAYKLPSNWGHEGSKKLPRPMFLWATVFLGTLAFFIIFWIGPHLTSPLIVMMLGVLLVVGMARFVKRFNWNPPSDLHQLALVSGALSFFIMIAPLQELDKTRTDNPVGMSLVGLAFSIGLVLFGRQIKRRMNSKN